MAELQGLAGAFEGLDHGVVQLVSDFDLLRDPARFGAEFDLVDVLARTSGRPLSMTWLQRDPGQFTAWFQIAFPLLEKWLLKNKMELQN